MLKTISLEFALKQIGETDQVALEPHGYIPMRARVYTELKLTI